MKCIAFASLALAAYGVLGYVAWVIWKISAYAGVNGF